MLLFILGFYDYMQFNHINDNMAQMIQVFRLILQAQPKKRLRESCVAPLNENIFLLSAIKPNMRPAYWFNSEFIPGVI